MENTENVHEVMPSRTPPRRKFGAFISENTPPRSLSRKGLGKSIHISGLDEDNVRQDISSINIVINPRETHGEKEKSDSVHYIDALLPESLHVYSSLPGPPQAPTTPALDTRAIHPTFLSSSLRTPAASSTNKNDFQSAVLSPSILRRMSPYIVRQGTSIKPRYSVLLQVLKSMSDGQSNHTQQPIGTNLMERLSTVVGAPAHHKQLSATLARKTQLLLELNEAAASDCFQRPDNMLLTEESKLPVPQALSSGPQRKMSLTAPDALSIDQQSASSPSQTTLTENAAPMRQAIESRDTIMLLAKSVTDEAQLLEARNEIAELQNQLRSFDLSERNRKRENESLRRENLELSSQISRLRNALDDKENQLSAKSTEFMECKGSLEDVKAELFQKKEELHFALRSNDKLKSKLSSAHTKLASATKESSDEIDLLATQNNELRQEITDLEGSRADLDRVVRSMRGNLAESETRMKEMREQLARERKATSDLQKYASDMQASMEKRLSDALAKLSHETSAKASADADHEMLRSKVASLNEQVRTQEGEIQDLREQVEFAKASTKVDNEDLQSRLAAERKKNDALSSELQAANLATARLKRDLDASLASSEERLLQYRSEMNSRLTKQDATIARKEKEIMSLKQVCNSLREGSILASQLKDSLINARCEIAQLEDHVKDLDEGHTTEIERLTRAHRKEIEKAQSEYHQLESGCRTLQDKRDAAHGNLKSTEKDLYATRQEKERLLAENEGLRSELHHAKDRIQELKWEVDALDRDGSNSDDSSDGHFSKLTRNDLKIRCTTQLDELQRLQAELLRRASDFERLEKRLSNSDSDLKLLSEELNKLAEINGQLDHSLSECRNALDAAGLRESSLKAQVHSMEETCMAMEKDLDQRSDMILSLRENVQQMAQQLSEQGSTQVHRDHAMEAQIERLTAENEDLSIQARLARDNLEKSKGNLLHVTKETKQLRARLSVAEEQLSVTTSRLQELTSQIELLQVSTSNEAQSGAIVDSLQSECSSLRIENNALKTDLEATRRSLDAQEAREHELEERLAFQQKSLIETEGFRELFESKYNQAAQLSLTQKETIRTLEEQVEESNSYSESLSAQIEALQSAAKNAEDTIALQAEDLGRQLKELDEKLSQVEGDCSLARQDANLLKDELRESRRRCTELEKENGQVQSRLESTRKMLSNANADLARERNHSDEASAVNASLKAEIDSQKSEVQHLKARTQLLDASLARLKSEHNLALAACRASEDGLRNELHNQRSELETKNRKLSSLSEIYHAQNDALNQFRLSETRFHTQLDVAISDADDSFNKLFVRGPPFEVESNRTLYALDLSEKCCTSENKAVMSDFASAWKSFKERCSKLGPAKNRSSDDAASVATSSLTPPKILSRTSIPETPDIKDALENVKRFFNEEVLSPNKARTSDPTQEDAHHFRKVIQSLESQIDTLLFDLKAANDALRSNTQIYADMEELVKHREQERDKLGLQVERRTAVIRELERRLERETTAKQTLEKQVGEFQQEAENAQQPSVADKTAAEEENQKLAAGRKVAVFLQDQERRIRASYFTRWACHVAVMKAAEQQTDFANQLAEELKTTRDKVSLLKKHLKNKNRGRESGGLLEVISEDSEQIDI